MPERAPTEPGPAASPPVLELATPHGPARAYVHAVAGARAALRPGGVLLVSVPGITPSGHQGETFPYYWRFTAVGLRTLLSEDGFDDVWVQAHGNLAAACAFLTGLAAVTTVVPQILIPLVVQLADPAQRGTAMSWVQAGLITGIMGARVVSGQLAGLLGWRWVFAASAVLTLVVACGRFACCRATASGTR